MSMSDANMPTWVLPALSWLVAFYFFLGFVIKIGFLPSSPMTTTEATYLFLWLLFLFLPFFEKVKIGKLLELERNIHQAKEEVKQLREQVQNNFAVMASSISTISNISNHVIVNALPSELAAQKAKQEFEKGVQPADAEGIEEIKNELVLEEDTIMALARTRIGIEYLLRSILGRRTEVTQFGEHPVKLMGLNQLYRELVKAHPDLKHMESSLSYVNKVCSAAIHAQQLPPGYADEALDMGARIIAVLNVIKNTSA